MAKIFLAVLAAHTGAGTTTLYYSSGGGFVSGPADTPANTFFDARLIQPVSIRRNLFATGTTRGATKVALGELVLNNNDGGLDPVLEYGFDGRDLTVYLGEHGAAFPGGFEAVFVGTMEQPEWDSRRVVFKVRDRQFDTRQPVQATLYAGTNSLPSGVEGVAGDLQGKPKPLTFGKVYNASPVRVNTDRHIYQFHAGALQSIAAMYSKGTTLTAGTAHASQAALEGATVSLGAFDTWLAGGMSRLHATDSARGTITGDPVEGANAAARTVAEIFERILEHAGVASGDIDDAALTALDTFNNAEVGIYIKDPRPIADCLDEVVGSIGGWWGQDPAGLFTAASFLAPTGSPAASFVEKDLLRLERVTTADAFSGLPAWRVILGWQKNYTVQKADQVDSTVTAARRGFLEQEYRTISDSDASVQTKHLLSPTLEIATLLTDATDAADEADRLQTLLGTRRDRYEARVKLNALDPQEIGLNDVVEITHSRFGLSGGELFRVLGIELDARRGVVNLTLWGSGA